MVIYPNPYMAIWPKLTSASRYPCTVGSQSHRCKIWVRGYLDGQTYNKTCSVTPICIPKGHFPPYFGHLKALGAINCIFGFYGTLHGGCWKAARSFGTNSVADCSATCGLIWLKFYEVDGLGYGYEQCEFHWEASRYARAAAEKTGKKPTIFAVFGPVCPTARPFARPPVGRFGWNFTRLTG